MLTTEIVRDAQERRLPSLTYMVLGRLSILLLLSVAIFWINPVWFGDAPFYAYDIAHSPPRLFHDSGHLVWRPIGLLCRSVLSLVGIQLDALLVLRGVSAVSAAGLVLATARLSRLLGAPRFGQLLGAVLVGCSHFVVSYGGSGCSYGTAVLLVMVALIVLLRRKPEWSNADAVMACAAITAAWACWGTAVLAGPSLLVVAFQRSQGSIQRRAGRTLGFGVLCGVATPLFAAAVFTIANGGTSGLGVWLASAGHDYGSSLSLIGVFRAGLGLLAGFLYLFELGTSVKGYLLKDPAFIGTDWVFGALIAACFALLVGYLAVRLLRAWRHRREGEQLAQLILVCLLVPSALFAVCWQGSDVERFAYVIPAFGVVAAVCIGPGRRRETVTVLAMASLLVSVNVLAYAVPATVLKRTVSHSLVDALRVNTSDSDVIVLAGSKFNGHVSSAASYLTKREIFSLSFDIQSNGETGWSDRFHRAVQRVRARGGHVHVMLSLIDPRDSNDSGFSRREYPALIPEDVLRSGELSSQGRVWRAAHVNFVEFN